MISFCNSDLGLVSISMRFVIFPQYQYLSVKPIGIATRCEGLGLNIKP